MRYGVLADIHGNLPALRAAINALEERGVERWIVAGDIVGYGPHPNECVDVVAGLGATCVAGNHDLIALGLLSDERCIALAKNSLRWTSETLSEDARQFLADLPLRARVDGRIEVAHGSLDDPQAYTTSAAQAAADLRHLEREGSEHALLLLGHTHRPFACGLRSGRLPIRTNNALALPSDDSAVLNPGAVGQARELRVRARCMVLDIDQQQALFLALPYDVRACRRALREASLPPRSYQLSPVSLRTARRIPGAIWRRWSRRLL
jgi:predicted phosphodiesterase